MQVKMESLKKEDFVRILSEVKNNLLIQAVELMKIDGVGIAFSKGAVNEIAEIAARMNEEDELGARRLRAVVDAVMEEINFAASGIVKIEKS